MKGTNKNNTSKLNWIPVNQYKRLKHQLKRQKINVVFNYSKIVVTEAMERVLNRGLKFAILPLKLDLSQVLTDLNAIWCGKSFGLGKKVKMHILHPYSKRKSTTFLETIKLQRAFQIF